MRARKAGGVAALALLWGTLAGVQPAAAAEVAVAATNFEFTPREVQVAEGDTITWTNTDPEPHTVTADDGSFSLVVDPGESVSRDFNSEAEIPYYCKLHGGPGGNGMAGTIIVGSPEPAATVNLNAADNVARSIAWSASTFADGAGFALLGRSDNFADSLASGAAQGKLDAPLLLTATGSLDPRVKAELERLGVRTVYILGGSAAISPAVESELQAAGYSVRRVAGADRLATAVAIAETFYPEARSALLVRAFASGGDPTRAFVDSLGAGAVAAATGQPVLFSETAALSATTKSYLASRPISNVQVIGGTAALAEKVVEDLTAMEVEAERVAGVNRNQTAAMVAEGLGEHDELVLVDGTDPNSWADGFAAASRRAPVLLSAGDLIPGPTAHLLSFAFTEGVVCGTTVTDVACGRAEVVRDLDTDLPAFGAFMTGEDRNGQPGARGIYGFYAGSDGTTLCYDYFGTIQEFTAAHIHRASDNTPVIPLALEPSVFDFFGCTFGITASALADVLANPSDYYANLHTTEFPAGAMSGAVTNLNILAFAGLLGESEVPGPGDPDAVGFAAVFTTDTPGQLCVLMFVDGLGSAATGAHIHEAARGQSGPAVVTLETPGEETFPANCYDADETLIADITADPSAYYVNVHTTDHPTGAIRGQLTPIT